MRDTLSARVPSLVRHGRSNLGCDRCGWNDRSVEENNSDTDNKRDRNAEFMIDDIAQTNWRRRHATNRALPSEWNRLLEAILFCPAILFAVVPWCGAFHRGLLTIVDRSSVAVAPEPVDVRGVRGVTADTPTHSRARRRAPMPGAVSHPRRAGQHRRTCPTDSSRRRTPSRRRSCRASARRRAPGSDR